MDYLWLLFAYLLGSIPFGYLAGKIFKKVDIRRYGSGNIGTTNVMRMMGPITAVLVLLLDLGKGSLAVILPLHYADSLEIMLASGFLVVFGHCYSVFLNFKGGKGAATGIGVMLAIPDFIIPFGIILLIAVILIGITRYVSLGSITGSILIPVFFWVWEGYSSLHVILGVALAVLVVWRHQDNLLRLVQGKEKKLGQKVKVDGEGS